ncbi:prepro-gonadotropin-releasing hormone-like protein [Ruditapes philippinarum]|uniref:Prepro-gonadotropin-releasing hormone-like protein n=1 Tax=Ruditapes philippinarum TaxID=129788 RepID=GRHLP_RUDPH|nr:prepro-gonadotropin-releasing hormone-like protein [Ruditapes philippinarum]XP_060572582.1 prepro-gonadotropin-releasing hormone-like protein [Ruditapes philippinarum]A0A0A7DNP6.1 RecName: Full=Prepro-gonadotropin-releasing hormone-like protein; Short=rp-GnRH; Contains: RecName: Full=GnRH dodecapeptide; Contains: RecName: Full=GnRH-associated peptide; Short=GAP; Flags: Precursor [Ruditapes philippinarum]AIU92925.1 gonadotropin-releasing hormone like peptide [Ruditapes philippinarum]
MNACILLTTLVTMITIEKVQGQSYHFSNGWNPGKRSMQEPVCHFRQDVQTLVLKLIEDEVYRMLSDPSCIGGVPTLRNFLKKDLAYTVPLDDKK